MESLEVDTKDVIKLMLQFLKENNLVDSWRALSNETNVSINTVDNLDMFILDIQTGKWDSVVNRISTMLIPVEKLQIVYEQIIFELLELNERDLAKEVLRETDPLRQLKESEPQRYLKLEQLCKRPFYNAFDTYEIGITKELRRQEIVDLLVPEISVVPPSRLLTLLNYSLKYQSTHGLVPKTGRFDIFRNSRKSIRADSEEKVPKHMGGIIRFNAAAHPETVTFSIDGQNLITGSVDGFIEVWNPDTCKIRKDLEYQAKDEFMAHINEAILCSTMSKDNEYLATGTQTGTVKVWKLSTGQCIKRLDQAHTQGITSLCFSGSQQLLTTSFDSTARIHGLKSGKILKEFRGHTSYVNQGVFTKDSQYIITASSDGTCKYWDAKTSECLSTFRPGTIPGGTIYEYSVHTLMIYTHGNTEMLFICSKGPYAYLMSPQGHLIRTFSSGKKEGSDFLCATISPQGNWVYCVGEDGLMYIFNAHTGDIENTIFLHEDKSTSTSTSIDSSSNSNTTASVSSPGDVIAIVHHPCRNLIVTTTDQGILKLWRP